MQSPEIFIIFVIRIVASNTDSTGYRERLATSQGHVAATGHRCPLTSFLFDRSRWPEATVEGIRTHAICQKFLNTKF